VLSSYSAISFKPPDIKQPNLQITFYMFISHFLIVIAGHFKESSRKLNERVVQFITEHSWISTLIFSRMLKWRFVVKLSDKFNQISFNQNMCRDKLKEKRIIDCHIVLQIVIYFWITLIYFHCLPLFQVMVILFIMIKDIRIAFIQNLWLNM
jgi:hypothetical protein